jgi:pyruvate kinase
MLELPATRRAPEEYKVHAPVTIASFPNVREGFCYLQRSANLGVSGCVVTLSYMTQQRSLAVKNKPLSDLEGGELLESLIAKLAQIRDSLINQEKELHERITTAHAGYRKSVANLIHYLALRHHDIRTLQDELASLGLSSLGRAESHTMWTIDAVLNALHHLAGQHTQPLSPAADLGFAEGRSMLANHTEALLGPAPAHRAVRIMVTMSADAATDYVSVRDLLAHGMNCMRINCAHDTPEAWSRMVHHLKRARRELGLPCRIFMDLAGPKLRTGPIEPGPEVISWHPRRDTFGKVTGPARICFVPEGSAATEQFVSSDADAVLRVPSDWLAELKPGQRIELLDARDKQRVLEVFASDAPCRWAHCSQTAYVIPASTLRRVDPNGEAGREIQIGALRARDKPIILHRGDSLILTSEPVPGRPAEIDSMGRTARPASISCTLPEVLSQVRSGERIWFDDGKIGGIVRGARPEALRIEITQVKPSGDKLLPDKGINLPDTNIRLPALSARDLEDLRFIVKHADLVGMSFVRRERDIRELQRHLHELDGDHLGVVLKIETRQAFERLPNLIMAAMRHYPIGVMIARGDLAVECGYERLAEVQEEILWICEAAHLPVIWATQVLQSLAKKGQPSRAEITDAAMGERAECVMLNKGPHIIAAVSVLDNILRRMQGHQSKKSSRLRRLHLSAKREADDA